MAMSFGAGSSDVFDRGRTGGLAGSEWLPIVDVISPWD